VVRLKSWARIYPFTLGPVAPKRGHFFAQAKKTVTHLKGNAPAGAIIGEMTSRPNAVPLRRRIILPALGSKCICYEPTANACLPFTRVQAWARVALFHPASRSSHSLPSRGCWEDTLQKVPDFIGVVA
jgi:uncharacterized protein (DUF2236 family)